jgi:hypothetical protein
MEKYTASFDRNIGLEAYRCGKIDYTEADISFNINLRHHNQIHVGHTTFAATIIICKFRKLGRCGFFNQKNDSLFPLLFTFYMFNEKCHFRDM